jgi:hypothetical protein
MENKIANNESSFSIIDLTADESFSDGSPFQLNKTSEVEQKILHLNDAFFDTWEECLMCMPVFAGNNIMLHCYVQSGDLLQNRKLAMIGWLLGYFSGDFK